MLLKYTSNFMTIGPVVSEIICLITIDTHDRQQTEGNGRPLLSYSRSHEMARKHESSQSPVGPYYNAFFAYALEVKINNFG